MRSFIALVLAALVFLAFKVATTEPPQDGVELDQGPTHHQEADLEQADNAVLLKPVISQSRESTEEKHDSRANLLSDEEDRVLMETTDHLPRTAEYQLWVDQWAKYYLLNNLKVLEENELTDRESVKVASSLTGYAISTHLGRLGRFQQLEANESYELPSSASKDGSRGFAIGMRLYQFHTSEYPEFDNIQDAFHQVEKEPGEDHSILVDDCVMQSIALAHTALDSLEHVDSLKPEWE